MTAILPALKALGMIALGVAGVALLLGAFVVLSIFGSSKGHAKP